MNIQDGRKLDVVFISRTDPKDSVKKVTKSSTYMNHVKYLIGSSLVRRKEKNIKQERWVDLAIVGGALRMTAKCRLDYTHSLKRI
jgi:hypothetical protein